MDVSLLEWWLSYCYMSFLSFIQHCVIRASFQDCIRFPIVTCDCKWSPQIRLSRRPITCIQCTEKSIYIPGQSEWSYETRWACPGVWSKYMLTQGDLLLNRLCHLTAAFNVCLFFRLHCWTVLVTFILKVTQTSWKQYSSLFSGANIEHQKCLRWYFSSPFTVFLMLKIYSLSSSRSDFVWTNLFNAFLASTCKLYADWLYYLPLTLIIWLCVPCQRTDPSHFFLN